MGTFEDHIRSVALKCCCIDTPGSVFDFRQSVSGYAARGPSSLSDSSCKSGKLGKRIGTRPVAQIRTIKYCRYIATHKPGVDILSNSVTHIVKAKMPAFSLRASFFPSRNLSTHTHPITPDGLEPTGPLFNVV